MITAKEAYLNVLARYPDEKYFLRSCLDYGDFWIFVVDLARFDGEKYCAEPLFGQFPAISKETGEELLYNWRKLPRKPRAEIPIEQVIGESGPVAMPIEREPARMAAIA